MWNTADNTSVNHANIITAFKVSCSHHASPPDSRLLDLPQTSDWLWVYSEPHPSADRYSILFIIHDQGFPPVVLKHDIAGYSSHWLFALQFCLLFVIRLCGGERPRRILSLIFSSLLEYLSSKSRILKGAPLF